MSDIQGVIAFLSTLTFQSENNFLNMYPINYSNFAYIVFKGTLGQRSRRPCYREIWLDSIHGSYLSWSFADSGGGFMNRIVTDIDLAISFFTLATFHYDNTLVSTFPINFFDPFFML